MEECISQTEAEQRVREAAVQSVRHVMRFLFGATAVTEAMNDEEVYHIWCDPVLRKARA